jgi:hypothetical protein
MPLLDNDGTCAARILSNTPLNAYTRANITFTQGGLVIMDTVPGRAGQIISQAFTLPKSGTWSITMNISDSLGNVSCDTTITRPAKGKPAPVSNLQ